jgi:signal transduction histidine kinase
MFANIAGYVGVSLLGRPTPAEQAQAALFLDSRPESAPRVRLWRGRASFGELEALVRRFVGAAGVASLHRYATERKVDVAATAVADPELIHHVETILAGSIGAASARLVVASTVEEAQLGVDEVVEMIDEASHVAALEERHRLARELHDSVSQVLFSMTLHTRAVELAVQRGGGDFDGRVARGLAHLRSLTQGALAEMRTSIFQLRPDALDEEGLASAIRKSAATIATQEGLEVRVHAPEERLPLEGRAEEELFRVVLEAVHNSVKHARPGRIEIRLREDPARDGTLTVEVADDGVGFDPAASHPSHLGINGMRERTERLGGRLVIQSAPGGPTTVCATLPGILRRPDAERL